MTVVADATFCAWRPFFLLLKAFFKKKKSESECVFVFVIAYFSYERRRKYNLTELECVAVFHRIPAIYFVCLREAELRHSLTQCEWYISRTDRRDGSLS